MNKFMDNFILDAVPPKTVNTPTLSEINNTFKKISKHPRYKSDWIDNKIVINIADDGEINERPLVYDLNEKWLPPNTPIGPFHNPVRLIHFPHWISIHKVIANEMLHNHKSHLYDRVKNGLTICTNFFEWCVKNGIYEISTLTQSDFYELAKKLSVGRWYEALDMETMFFNLTLRLSNDKKLLYEIINNEYQGLNTETLSRLTGINLSLSQLPNYFYKNIFDLAEIKQKWPSGRDDFDLPFSELSLTNIFGQINLLHNLPNGFDKPKELPYPKYNNLAKALCKNKIDSRTKNLSIEDSVKLLKLAINYVYDYAPGIIKLGNNIRDFINENTEDYVSRKSKYFIQKEFKKLNDIYKFPIKSITNLNQNENGANKKYKIKDGMELCFLDFIRSLQTACMILIGMNHGRRKNEILGEKYLPYGIYLGCIAKTESHLDSNKIDFYIEKNIRSWSEFLCNQLVVDAESVLEDVYNLFRPLNSERLTGEYLSKNSRREKLFRYKLFSKDALNSEKWSSYIYNNHSSYFICQAGVDPNYIDHKTHIFRRFFALIYFYRYDNAILQSLQKHLKQHTLATTRKYVTDPTIRKQAESIEILYIQENTSFDNHLNLIGKEYLKDKISEIINGHPTGGGMSRTVYRLYKHLLRRVEFRILDTEKQKNEIGESLISHGYAPTPIEHGACMLSPSCNQSKAKCFNDNDKIARNETACLKKCMHCCYNFDNENYINTMKIESNKLKNMSTDFTISTAERLSYADAVNELDELIKLESCIQQTNAEKIMALKVTAKLFWGHIDNLEMRLSNAETTSIKKLEETSTKKHQSKT